MNNLVIKKVNNDFSLEFIAELELQGDEIVVVNGNKEVANRILSEKYYYGEKELKGKELFEVLPQLPQSHIIIAEKMMKIWQDGMIEPIVAFRPAGENLCNTCNEIRGCITSKREVDDAKKQNRAERIIGYCEGYGKIYITS